MRNASDKRTHLGGLMDKSTLVDQVYRALRDRILGGEFSPGEKLSLSGLAKDLEVSNSPLREAVSRLEREIWSRVVYGGQAASSVDISSPVTLTPSLKTTPPTTSVSSSDLLSRRHRP